MHKVSEEKKTEKKKKKKKKKKRTVSGFPAKSNYRDVISPLRERHV